jgi:hypothetical protein
MALMDTERIRTLHLQKKQTLTLTLQELSLYTETPYKTFDFWIKEGLMPASYIQTGTSGYDRSFTYEGCFIALLLGQLEEAGFGTQKLRGLIPPLLEKMDAPYGYIAIDVAEPQNLIHVEGDYAELSATIRQHFRYGNSSPTLIYDLNRLHILLLDYAFDAGLRWEVQTAIAHLGPKADWTRLGELVTRIDDIEEYERNKAKKKTSKSRFR